jgi:hypothetical protein
LINERFGRGWSWFSVGDLFLLNFLTIVAEFIGISLAASYFGVSRYIVVPISAVALVAIMASGSFRRWERAMFAFIAVTLLLLSGILMATTLFPDVNVVAVTEYLVVAIVIGVIVAVGALRWLERRHGPQPFPPPLPGDMDRTRWRMPQLALLEPVTWSAGTELGMLALRGYRVIGAVLLVVKAVQLGSR